MFDQLIDAGMQYRQAKLADEYAVSVLGKVKSIQEEMGAEAVEMIESAAATLSPVQSVSADPNIGQNVDIIV